MNTESEQDRPYGNILVVEDDTITLILLTDLLTQTGYSVQTASDGEDALHSVQTKRPEMILLDYNMPGMNGIEVCRHLKKDSDTKDIPVIFLSGLEETYLKVKALEAGAIDYITKPIEFSELLVRIANHLKLYRLQQKLAKEIEERKQAEKKLHESEERFRTAFESSNDCILICDKAYNFLYANQAAIDHVGTSADKVIGKNIPEVLWHVPDFMQLLMDRIDQVINTGKMLNVQDETVMQGHLYYTDSSISPLRASDGSVIAACVIYRDITEQKKMEKQLFLNEKLITTAGLAAGVAHELNTPLSAILQAHQLVEIGLSPTEAHSKQKAGECNVDLAAVQKYFKQNELDFFMDGIRESALKASNIIRSLLDFSRPHEGTFASVAPEEIVENSLLLSQADYDMKKKYAISNIHIVKEYSPNLPPLLCVATEIEQVLLELIKNSAQALAEGDLSRKPCITLRTAATDERVVFEVEDNGPGISKDVAKHIFDPFFTTRDVGKGTGLGLSVAHAIIVDKHKGEFRMESEPGQGTKFIIELPLVQLMAA